MHVCMILPNPSCIPPPIQSIQTNSVILKLNCIFVHVINSMKHTHNVDVDSTILIYQEPCFFFYHDSS